MQSIKTSLEENGYAVVPNVLNEAEVEEIKASHKAWRDSLPNHDIMHKKISPHGIYKFHEVGHQRHAWLTRINPKVQSIFKYLWDTDDLVVSFDGSCYIPKEEKRIDKLWTHTDQAPGNKNLECYQGFVALTSNTERTLIVYPKSHMHFKELYRDNNSKTNWNLIKAADLEGLEKKALEIPAGSLVLWDSRTFHQNRYGAPNSEERLVQYVCYLPKSHPKNTENMKQKRLKYYNERRTTSHWPCPIKVNGKQPQTYGNDSLLINYDELIPPNLEDIQEEIMKLL